MDNFCINATAAETQYGEISILFEMNGKCMMTATIEIVEDW